MFKVGDKVVCVDSSLSQGQLTVGQTYTVEYAVRDVVMVDNDHKVWSAERFVPAPEYSAAQQLNETARYLPDETEVRKDYPLFDGLFGYFPNALCEVARWSKHSNQQHNPGEPMHWAKDKSTDHKNKIMRHTLDAEQLNKDGFYEAIGAAWRALALAEEILVASGKPWGANVK